MTKTYSIDWIPCGRNAFASFAATKPFHFFSGTQYGTDKVFREWVFDRYGADVVKENKKTKIRFIDEKQMFLFIMEWS